MKKTRRLMVLVVGMAVAALTAALVGTVRPVHGAPVLPQGFTQSQVVSGLTNPTDMEFAPDGRLFVKCLEDAFCEVRSERVTRKLSEGIAYTGSYAWVGFP